MQLRPSSSELSEPADITAWPRGSAAIWSELFPAEQARIVQLLVERVDVRKDALEMRIRAEASRASSASCGSRASGKAAW